MVLKKKQKRLVFFLPNFILGGAGESIFKLSKFLVKYNFLSIKGPRIELFLLLFKVQLNR